MSQEIASFYAKIDADTKGFKKGLDDTKDGMSGLEKASSGIGKVAASAFAIGVTGAVAFGAAIGKSVSVAADFEQGITDISAVMGLTTKETEKLQAHITDLGLDPNLKVSATEATSAIMSLGTAGLSLDEILGGASEATIRLSNATGGDMGDAAALVTDAMSQFGLTAQDTGHIVDQLTGLTVASKFSFQDAALAFSQVGGVAGSVGLSLEDTNAILATTASNFSSGSDAGTSLKTMLTTLIPKSQEAEDVMGELGLVTVDYGRMSEYLSKVLGEQVAPSGMAVYEAFQKTNAGAEAAKKGNDKLAEAFQSLKNQYSENQFFDDTTGKMKSGADIAGVLQGAFSGLSEEQKLNAASTIFGTDAMRTAFALIDAGTPGVNEMADAIGKVNAGDIAAKRMDTFSGALEIAQGVIETLTISVGQQFLPILRPLVEGFSNLAGTVGPKLVSFFGMLATAMGDTIQKGIQWATEVLPPLWQQLVDVGKVIGNLSNAIFRALKPVTDTIGKWLDWKDVLAAVGILLIGPLLGAIGAAIAAVASFVVAFSPVLLTIAAVAAAIAALRLAWKNNFLGIQEITQDALIFIGDWLREKTGLWKGDWTKTLNYLLHHSDEVWNDISKSVQDTFNDWTREATHIVLTWTTWVVKEIVDWAARTKGHFENWVGWIVGDFGVLTKMKEKAVKIFESILGWWDDHIQPWIDAGRDVVQGLWDGISERWDKFNIWWQGVWRGSVQWVKDLLGIHSPSAVFYDIGSNMMTGLAQGVESMADAVTNAVSSAISPGMSLLDALGTEKADTFIDNLKQAGANAQKSLQAGGVAKGNAAYAFADAITKETAGNSLSSLFDDITGLVSQLNAKGVGGAKAANLNSMADYLDRLTSGDLSTYVPPAETPTGGGELSMAILDVLTNILQELRRGGSISQEGFNSVVNALRSPRGSGGMDYGSQTNFMAAGRR